MYSESCDPKGRNKLNARPNTDVQRGAEKDRSSSESMGDGDTRLDHTHTHGDRRLAKQGRRADGKGQTAGRQGFQRQRQGRSDSEEGETELLLSPWKYGHLQTDGCKKKRYVRWVAMEHACVGMCGDLARLVVLSECGTGTVECATVPARGGSLVPRGMRHEGARNILLSSVVLLKRSRAFDARFGFSSASVRCRCHAATRPKV